MKKKTNSQSQSFFNDLNFKRKKTEWLRGGIKQEGGKKVLVIELANKISSYFRTSASRTNEISFVVIKKAESICSDEPAKWQDYFSHFLMINEDEVWPVITSKSNLVTLAVPASKDRPLSKLTFTLSDEDLQSAAYRNLIENKEVLCAKFEIVISIRNEIGIFKIPTPDIEIEAFVNHKESIKSMISSRSIF